VEKKPKGNIAFSSAVHGKSGKDCKQSYSMQTRALPDLDRNYSKLFIRAKQLQSKKLIDKTTM